MLYIIENENVWSKLSVGDPSYSDQCNCNELAVIKLQFQLNTQQYGEHHCLKFYNVPTVYQGEALGSFLCGHLVNVAHVASPILFPVNFSDRVINPDIFSVLR